MWDGVLQAKLTLLGLAGFSRNPQTLETHSLNPSPKPLSVSCLEEVLLHATWPGHHGPGPTQDAEARRGAKAVHHVSQLVEQGPEAAGIGQGLRGIGQIQGIGQIPRDRSDPKGLGRSKGSVR